MGHGRRQLLWFAVTRYPTAEWLAQQIVEAFPWHTAPTYLVRDNDGAYGQAFTRRVRAMGIRDRPISPRSPWQNPYAERLIDTAITGAFAGPLDPLGHRRGPYGVIYPPQVAIVGFGKVVVRPWIVDGSVVPRSVVTVTLAGDHRVSDGHAGALFLAENRQAVAGARQAMSNIDVDTVLREELGNIAPEVDLKIIDPSADLREALDIDSMDFLIYHGNPSPP